ncbi:NHLP leader peptide family natural product precursor [Xylanibacillus composti]|uniref:Nitrile hydratase alpha/Thiocyanate hydrolase gamma domain-containing protein n=1 Tax=Xylanibacillus composti TaxID=1572762 RepID=A0A8J4H611_9BACL|nr:NHLP leader peptide family RiPP precursor [Xylanibacillus composti]MDT9724602.1 NHLP leader peptide family natural product precursor [Xylanibacillus composti]GIQ70216.1 hypothetical protein XYCOK13_30400 [Xylanibacillus composti]
MSKGEQLRQQIIQKAWADPAFKQLLLSDPRKALKEAFQIDVPPHIQLETLEETDSRYYLVIPPNPSTAIRNASDANVRAEW